MQGDQRIWLTDDAVWLTVPDPAVAGEQAGPAAADPRSRARRHRKSPAGARSGTALRFTFPGASLAATLEPFGRVPTHVSYLIGNDPSRWQRDVPVWSGVRYRDLYPGVDLVIGGDAVRGPAVASRSSAGSELASGHDARRRRRLSRCGGRPATARDERPRSRRGATRTGPWRAGRTRLGARSCSRQAMALFVVLPESQPEPGRASDAGAAEVAAAAGARQPPTSSTARFWAARPGTRDMGLLLTRWATPMSRVKPNPMISR